MEFCEKLKELRTAKSLTQEELAEALFVSRTAISKWESGRGFPSLASLQEISKYFSISIDDLIDSKEIISIAENENKRHINRFVSVICNALDVFVGLLFFLPIFGNGTDNPSSLPLYSITNMSLWIKIVVMVLISLTVISGLSGIILACFNKPIWNRHRLVAGVALIVIDVMVFILIRQPYPSIITLIILMAKVILIGITIYKYPYKKS